MILMSKIVALDLGDRWVGTAITDASQSLVRPYKTIQKEELDAFLIKTIQEEEVKTIVIGYPLTMSGVKSDQTLKIVAEKEELEKKFPDIKFVLWDERLSSKRAQELSPGHHSRQEKHKEHSRAAAFILDSYITSLYGSKSE